MGVFWGIIGGSVGLVVGFVATAVLSYFVMGALDVSNFEGERDMTSVFFWGPLGGLAGLGLGLGICLALTIRRARRRSEDAIGRMSRRRQGISLSVISIIGALTRGGRVRARTSWEFAADT